MMPPADSPAPSADPIPAAPGGIRAMLLLIVLPVLASVAGIAFFFSNWPLGVLGEWVWNRVPSYPDGARLVPVALAAAIYLAIAWLGHQLLRRKEAWLIVAGPLLLISAGGLQLAWMDYPETGKGLERWAPALFYPATSGYLAHARSIRDPRVFLREYKGWIAKQDNFHIGTHPPGLFLLSWAAIEVSTRRPTMARRWYEACPARFRAGVELVAARAALRPTDEGALALIATFTCLIGLVTMFGIYFLARQGADALASWWAAALWPAVPAPVVFLPISDCCYPALAVTALALFVFAARSRWEPIGLLAGAAIWLGLFCSLAFLAILAIALAAALWWKIRCLYWSLGRAILLLSMLGLGLALPTFIFWRFFEVDLLAIWRINLEKHAGFYERMPRSHGAWLLVNLVELCVAAGPAAFVVALVALFRAMRSRDVGMSGAVVATWFVIVVLDLSGRNRGEVARLWLPLLPLVVTAAAWAMPGRSLAWFGFTWLLCQIGVTTVAVGSVEPLLPVPLAANARRSTIEMVSQAAGVDIQRFQNANHAIHGKLPLDRPENHLQVLPAFLQPVHDAVDQDLVLAELTAQEPEIAPIELLPEADPLNVLRPAGAKVAAPMIADPLANGAFSQVALRPFAFDPPVARCFRFRLGVNATHFHEGIPGPPRSRTRELHLTTRTSLLASCEP